MKKMKKLAALVLAGAMVLGMSTTAFAASPATVTIDGPDGTAYKYMKLVTEDRDSVIGWEFATDAIEEAFVAAFANGDADFTADDALEALIAVNLIEDQNGDLVEEEDNKYVKAGDINPNEDLGEALSTLQASATETINGASVTFDEEDGFGLYMITAKLDGYTYIPMAVYISTDYADVNVTAKGAKDEITKGIDKDEDKSVSQGDIVEFTANTMYPFYSADVDSPTFTVTDELTNATYNASSVYVYLDIDGDGIVLDEENNLDAGDVLLEEGVDKDYTLAITDGASTDEFTQKMVIDFKYNANYASENVVIKYDVTVGAGAADVENTISTNIDTEGDYVKLDKVEVKVIKHSDDTPAVPLSGATFAIYEAVAAATDGYTAYENVKVAGTQGTTTLYLKDVTSQCGATAITDANGELTFSGLDAQKTYYIKETNAPVGYSLNDNYYLLDGGNEETTTVAETYVFDNFDDETVIDTKLSALPSTGGIGTTIFTVGGVAIIIAAAALLMARRRVAR